MYNFISNTSRCHYMVPSVPISSFKHQHKCQSKCHCTSYGRHGRFWTPIPLWAVQRMELYRAWNWSIWETKSKCKWNVSDFDHSNIFIIFLVKSTIYNFFFWIYSVSERFWVPFQISFQFKRGVSSSNIALDDVTLIEGTCGKDLLLKYYIV